MTHDRDRRGLQADDGETPRILALPAGWASPLHHDLESLVAERRAAAGLHEHRVCVTIDVPPDAHVALAGPVAEAVALLVDAAFVSAVRPDPASDMPHVPEVVITGVVTGGALELEIAASGCPTPDADAGVCAARGVLERIGGAIVAVPCPEGGRAVTLRLPRAPARRQAA
ncbi:MAG: hypothetical protein ACKOC8_04750 [Pirellulales bacterium]